jgi:hypothetical protein
MPVFKVTITGEALQRLADKAVDERRPLDLQAEVLVLQALGCWPPAALPPTVAQEPAYVAD